MRQFFLFACLASLSLAYSGSVSQALYQKIIYYAQLSAAAFEGDPCQNPPYGISTQYSFDTGHNTFQSTGVEGTIFRNDSTHEFILAFAATNNTPDYVEDLNATLEGLVGTYPCDTSCKAHSGFQTAYYFDAPGSPGSASSLVNTGLAAAFKQYPSYTLTITGASLGAALASLAWADLYPTYASKVTQVFTYGEPRVGNVAFANHIDTISGAGFNSNPPGLYHRVTHANDIVVKLPAPGANGPDQYRHSQTEYWESLDPENGDANTYQTTYQCIGQEDVTCNFGDGSTFDNVMAHETYAGFASVNCTLPNGVNPAGTYA